MATAAEGAVELLFSAEDIAHRIDELAANIAAAGLRDPVVVPILKGSFVFAADLVRALYRQGLHPEIDFMFLAFYDGAQSPSERVRVLHDPAGELASRDVILVDDILDSGVTLAFAKERLIASGARRVLTCVLVDKQVPRKVKVAADFTGFVCPPVFVVGYGMDLHNRYRELPFIGRIAGPQNPGSADQ